MNELQSNVFIVYTLNKDFEIIETDAAMKSIH